MDRIRLSEGALGENPRRTDKIRARDPAELEAVARENLQVLARAARAAGLAPDDAVDAVQETLLVFVEKAHQFDGRARVRTWLFGILFRKMAESRRAHWRESVVDEPDAFLEERFSEAGFWTRPLQLPDARAAEGQAMAWFDDCLDRLNPRLRSAFVLREIDQLETDELCNVLGVTANNLGVLLFRARNVLRGCLEHHGIRGTSDVAL